MQISSFNGGLNKRVSPYLLQSNEGVKYSNIDTTTGALAPLKENKDLNAKIKPHFTYFNGHWVNSDEERDYVKFQDKLFYSNGVTRPQWSKDGFIWYGLGIDKPDKAPVLSSFSANESQDIFEVVYEDLSLAKEDFNEYTNIAFPASPLDYEVICYKDVTIDGSSYRVYMYGKVKSTTEFGFILQISTPGGFCYIQGPDDKVFFRYDKKQAIIGFSQFDNVVSTYTKVLETLDVDKVFLQQQGTEELNLVIFKALTPGQIESIETKNVKINVDGKVIKYIKITLETEVSELFVFIDNFLVTTQKNRFNQLEWFIIMSSKGTSLEDFVSKTGLNVVSYVYTYTSEDGVESVPSDKSDFPIQLSPLYVEVKPSQDPQVTGINIYRVGNGLTQYSLIARLPNIEQKFVDDLAIANIDGAVLNSYNNTPAPAGLEYLTLYNTILFGSIKDKLYYTNIANPFVWSQFNFIDFDDIITGIGGTSNGLLVFTRHSTYIITGTSPDTFSKYTLSSGVGCILHKSIQSLQNTLLWLSEDSICASNGGNIQTLSRDKLNIIELKTPRCSAVLNDVYYLSHNSGTLIADFRFGLTFRESNKVYYGLDVKDNTLYGVEVDDKFVEVNGGEKPLEIQYLSPKFSDGSISTMKIYKDIYFHSTGNLKAKVFIDDNLAGEQVLNKGFTEIKVNSAETRGYSIQFEVTGTGTLNEIEYKVEGRQNGR